ncbi:MAG: CDP-alcohol phosphatidyltransferase family protein [Firmicutes bacterium]|nr:CDP-alcohol phosphatidyltransferase family protein [Bacillota bacterium]
MKRHIPNILSASRVILSPLLLIPAIVSRPAIYLPLYIIIFSTDILDGRIARRLHIESELGAKIDSAGDILFFACAICSVVISPIVVETRDLICAAIGFALFFLASAATFAKFRVLILTMHTWIAKLFDLALAVIILVIIAMGRISFPLVLVALGFAALSAVEGIATVITSKTYNSSHRGVMTEKIIAKQGEDGWYNKMFYFLFY